MGNGTFSGPRQIINKQILTNNSTVSGIYSAAYTAINNANLVLENIDVVNDAQRDRVRGEALFIRAFMHFELVRLFAKPYSDGNAATNLGVVIRTDASSFNGPDLDGDCRARNTVQEVYDQVITDLTEADISPKHDKKPGISSSERQWLQIEMVQNKETKPFFDAYGLKQEMDKWKYPLHFIDFETTAVAIPFNKGRKPYEGVAFQFSHHIVYEDGTVEHYGQYLNTEQGIFPNYDFVRNLKAQLEKDNGTIFRYAPHENTYLNLIYRQLLDDPSPIDDRGPLCEFIKTITKSVGSSSEKWEGDRCMIDMWDLVKRYYYDPYTNGSNSIKYVLPAILNSSKYLQEKYSKPVYGNEKGIKSLNFKDWTWIELSDGEVVDPYKRLPKMFQDASEKNMILLTEDDELANGGAALTAYGKLQFSEISEYEKEELQNALLKYCELDTLAMVMIFEAWREMINEQIDENEAA